MSSPTPTATHSSSAASSTSREPSRERVEYRSRGRQSFDATPSRSVPSRSPSSSAASSSSASQTDEQVRTPPTTQPVARGPMHEHHSGHPNHRWNQEVLTVQDEPHTSLSPPHTLRLNRDTVVYGALPVCHAPLLSRRRVSKREFATMLHGEDDNDGYKEAVDGQRLTSLQPLVATHRSSRTPSPSPKRRRLNERFRDHTVAQAASASEPTARNGHEQVGLEPVAATDGSETLTRNARDIERCSPPGNQAPVSDEGVESCRDNRFTVARVRGGTELTTSVEEPTGRDASQHEVVWTACERELDSTATRARHVEVTARVDELPAPSTQSNAAWPTHWHPHPYPPPIPPRAEHCALLPPPPPPVTQAEIQFARDAIEAASRSRRGNDIQRLRQQLRAFACELVRGISKRRRGRTFARRYPVFPLLPQLGEEEAVPVTGLPHVVVDRFVGPGHGDVEGGSAVARAGDAARAAGGGGAVEAEEEVDGWAEGRVGERRLRERSGAMTEVK